MHVIYRKQIIWEHMAKGIGIRGSGAPFPVLAMFRSVGQTFYCILPLVCPAVMGTWWMKIVSEWLKLPPYLHDVCTVFSQGR